MADYTPFRAFARFARFICEFLPHSHTPFPRFSHINSRFTLFIFHLTHSLTHSSSALAPPAPLSPFTRSPPSPAPAAALGKKKADIAGENDRANEKMKMGGDALTAAANAAEARKNRSKMDADAAEGGAKLSKAAAAERDEMAKSMAQANTLGRQDVEKKSALAAAEKTAVGAAEMQKKEAGGATDLAAMQAALDRAKNAEENAATTFKNSQGLANATIATEAKVQSDLAKQAMLNARGGAGDLRKKQGAAAEEKALSKAETEKEQAKAAQDIEADKAKSAGDKDAAAAVAQKELDSKDAEQQKLSAAGDDEAAALKQKEAAEEGKVKGNADKVLAAKQKLIADAEAGGKASEAEGERQVAAAKAVAKGDEAAVKAGEEAAAKAAKADADAGTAKARTDAGAAEAEMRAKQDKLGLSEAKALAASAARVGKLDKDAEDARAAGLAEEAADKKDAAKELAGAMETISSGQNGADAQVRADTQTERKTEGNLLTKNKIEDLTLRKRTEAADNEALNVTARTGKAEIEELVHERDLATKSEAAAADATTHAEGLIGADEALKNADIKKRGAEEIEEFKAKAIREEGEQEGRLSKEATVEMDNLRRRDAAALAKATNTKTAEGDDMAAELSKEAGLKARIATEESKELSAKGRLGEERAAAHEKNLASGEERLNAEKKQEGDLERAAVEAQKSDDQATADKAGAKANADKEGTLKDAQAKEATELAALKGKDAKELGALQTHDQEALERVKKADEQAMRVEKQTEAGQSARFASEESKIAADANASQKELQDKISSTEQLEESEKKKDDEATTDLAKKAQLNEDISKRLAGSEDAMRKKDEAVERRDRAQSDRGTAAMKAERAVEAKEVEAAKEAGEKAMHEKGSEAAKTMGTCEANLAVERANLNRCQAEILDDTAVNTKRLAAQGGDEETMLAKEEQGKVALAGKLAEDTKQLVAMAEDAAKVGPESAHEKASDAVAARQLVLSECEEKSKTLEQEIASLQGKARGAEGNNSTDVASHDDALRQAASEKRQGAHIRQSIEDQRQKYEHELVAKATEISALKARLAEAKALKDAEKAL